MDLLTFYRGEAPDYLGRRLVDIWAWDDNQLEMVHNYIQVLFPLRDPSLFSMYAPLLNDAIVADFRGDERLRANLDASFVRMLRFYGFRLDTDSGKVSRADNFASRAQEWVAPFDHNYRRITRILLSLSDLGLQQRAQAFFEALTELYRERPREIGEETFGFWRNAVMRSDS